MSKHNEINNKTAEIIISAIGVIIFIIGLYFWFSAYYSP